MEILICLGAEDGPSTGAPAYPDEQPDLHGEPVWGVYEVRQDDESAEWEYTHVAHGLTLAEALRACDEGYPERASWGRPGTSAIECGAQPSSYSNV
jgi:hypothetical protein